MTHSCVDTTWWAEWKPVKETQQRHRTCISTSLLTRTSQLMMSPPDQTSIANIRKYGKGTVRLMSTSAPQDHASPITTYDNTTISSCPLYNRHLGDFTHHIVRNNGILFTDGSFNNGISAFAWAAQPPRFGDPLKNIDFNVLFAWHSDLVDGSIEDQNSYRAELGGILDAINSTNQICNHENITKGSCTIYCDSKGALCAAFGNKRPTPRWASYDLVRNIRCSIAKSPITCKYKHMKGHQDLHKKIETLNLIAQGNVLVDYLASSRLHKNSHQQEW